MRAGVFLDRDGVLNVPEFKDGRSFAPKNLENFILYPDAISSVKRLHSAGFLVIIVTNQPDVGMKLLSQKTIEQMHDILRSSMPIDRIEVCFDSRDVLNNRLKPSPDMIVNAAKEMKIDLNLSFMIGDRASDITAGVVAGCKHSIFIDRGYTSEKAPNQQSFTTYNLKSAVDWLLAKSNINK